MPSGASTGRHEALELRDGDAARYGGRGVRTAVGNVQDVIAPALIDGSARPGEVDEALIDLDGTPHKSRLGANAMLAVSLATARAAAASAGVPLWRHLAGDRSPLLPLPMVNIISGGLHAGTQLDFQDFLVMPVGARSYGEALEMCVDVYTSDRRLLVGRRLFDAESGRGRLRPGCELAPRGARLIQQGIGAAGLTPGDDMRSRLMWPRPISSIRAAGVYRLASEGRDCDAAGDGRAGRRARRSSSRSSRWRTRWPKTTGMVG